MVIYRKQKRGESQMTWLGLLSLMFGVFGMCFSIIFIGIFPCILSVILGCIALKNEMADKWPSVLGLVCSTIGMIMAIVVMTQSPSWNTPSVATPTEVVRNLTIKSGNEQESNTGKNNGKQVSLQTSNQNRTETVDAQTNSENIENRDESTAAEEATIPQSGNDHAINMDFDAFSISYAGHEVSSDYDGNPCVIIYFDFTNNSDEPTNASTSIYSQVFQNGIECDLSFVTNGNEYLGNASKDIQKGTTIRVGTARSISDMSDIDVTIKEAFSFSDKSDSMTIKLN